MAEDSRWRPPSSTGSIPATERYLVQHELGRGAMGIVYQATDRLSQRPVALKVLSATLISPKRLERFRREGELVAGLDHPGIVRVFSATSFEGRPCLVYELVPQASTLGEALPNADTRTRVRWIAEVGDAVGHAHARGVVHRDLKPDNVLVGTDGQARVTDFGVGFRGDQQRLTQTGALVGTPHYMAPEQLRGKGGIGPHSDVFSLGVMLYEALCGERPFVAGSLPELYATVASGRYTPLRERMPELSPELEAVCHTALNVDPAVRYADGQDFAAALKDCLLGDSLEGPAPRRRPLPWLVAVLLSAAAAAGLWATLGNRNTPAAPPTEALAALRVEQLPDVVWGVEVVLKGTAPTGVSRVRVTAANAQRRADVHEGAFSTRLRLPAGVHAVRVEPVDGEAEPAEVTVELRPPPAWYQTLRTRPPLPLPEGLGFGESSGEFTNAADESVFVWVPPGTLIVGEHTGILGPERSEHDVGGFFMGKYEVTRRQWAAFVLETGAQALPDLLYGSSHDYTDFMPKVENTGDVPDTFRMGPEHPALYVSWVNAMAYAAWAGCRLPTELEWEFAARGEEGNLFPWGNDPDPKYFNHESDADGFPYSSPVGSFPEGASPFGCLDMAGNAMEWTHDVFASQDGVERRVIRGGAWNAVPFICQSVYRDGSHPSKSLRVMGLRLAR